MKAPMNVTYNDSQELVVFHSPTHRLLPILQKDLAEL